MRTARNVVLLFGVLLFVGFGFGPFWRGTTLKPNEVKAKWGALVFNASQFKEGPQSIKSKMAYSIMTDKSLIGKSAEYIRNTLGAPDGFYFIDIYPAYIIQEGRSQKEETWQLVFMLNSEYKVRDIIVHKNCCD